MSKRILATLFLAAFLALAGCDNDSGSISQPGSGGDDGGGGDGGTDDGGSVDLQLGSDQGDGFEAGTLAVGESPIAASGSTGISGQLVDEEGEPAGDGSEVTFSSSCIEDDLADIRSPVTVTNGEFSTTYTAAGCSGSDTVTATVEVGPDDDTTTLTASATLEVEPATLGRLVFAGAEPELIGLRGMGNAGVSEIAEVTFIVQDDQGNPSSGRTVDFSLSATTGGLELSNTEATSNSQGEVVTQVSSGTVPTSVRVKATVRDMNISSQSSAVAVSTGIPEQQGVSLALETHNPPVQGCIGEDVEVIVHARDRFSNPPVDGTVVNFSTEGGRIESSCMLVDGECTVNWTSQAPMPARSTLLAYLQGEESFKDRTGDGLFGEEERDAANPHVWTPADPGYDPNDPESHEDISWVDVPEPYRDDDWNQQYEPGIDGFYWDFNGNKEFDGANDKFDGALCGAGIENETDREAFQNDRCGQPTAPIGMSTIMALTDNRFVDLTVPASYTVGSGPLTVEASDPNGGPLPAGSTVAVEVGYGEIIGPASVEVGSTNEPGPMVFNFSVSESGEDDTTVCETGTVTVTTAGNSCDAGVEVTREFEICGSG